MLDYGSGNIASAHRALRRTGADVEVTADFDTALNADGLVVPGVGAFAAVMAGLHAVRGERIIDRRLAGSRPVLGICVGMQVMFERGIEHGVQTDGVGEWPGVVERLQAAWCRTWAGTPSNPGPGAALFAGVDPDTRYYFVHSYAARRWELPPDERFRPPVLTWAEHDGDRFIAAVENGPLSATQFHPEKSGDAGAELLARWVERL